jgi:hypothetical protein
LITAGALDVRKVLADQVPCSGSGLRNIGDVPRPNWDVHSAYVEHAPATCQQVLRPISPQATSGTNEEPAVVARNPDDDAAGATCLAPISCDLDLALLGRGFDDISTELGHRSAATARLRVLFACVTGEVRPSARPPIKRVVDALIGPRRNHPIVGVDHSVTGQTGEIGPPGSPIA